MLTIRNGEASKSVNELGMDALLVLLLITHWLADYTHLVLRCV